MSILSSLFSSALLAWPAPTSEMKPWAYNWWMGSAVDEAGLRVQVEEMSKVGMGGMHVIPTYSRKDASKDKVMLSPDWMEAFGDAVRIAGEKGLGVDLTMGSGWCFGGPQLTADEGCWALEVTSDRAKLKPAGHPRAAKVLWEGADADGKPVILFTHLTGQKVKRAGPGGQGPMMNPFSPRAMADFLKPFATAFDAPGAPKPRCFYHDSYEYYGAAWGPELLDAFRAKRGYALEDHYADLAGVGTPDAVARVKCDYRETLSDLMVEDVFPQWASWCAARGIRTRNEAHGSPCNLLDFYAVADVPETEMFVCDKAKAREPSVSAAFINSGDRNILISKLASSAAHVKHAGAATDPAVSSESCTWICEHFCETAGAVKTFLDRLFLSGVNHVFYHGMCYSAADAKWPGWTFYASLEMNRFNPLWHDADVLNAYVARVQSIARTTAIDNDLLVYWPLHDLWMDPKGFEQQLTVHGRGWMTEQPVGRIAQKLYDDGYAFDFVSERQLATLGAPAATRYTTIVVPAAKYMKPATLRRLFALADAGYKVLFVDGMPSSVPGFRDVAAGEAEIRSLAVKRPARVSVGALDELMAASPARREPFNRSAGLMYTRHAKDGRTYYFIANQYRDEGVRGGFRPASVVRSACLMNPLDGTVTAIPVAEGIVRLDLPIGHSIILVTSSNDEGWSPAAPAHPARGGRDVLLAGDWTRTAKCGGPELPAPKTAGLPMPWGLEPSGAESSFSGTMRYETTFECLPAGERTAVLDLGRVRESAKVYVNESYVGAAIMAPWTVAFPACHLHAGANSVAVEVTSTGANRLRWLDRAKPYEWKVFTDINVVDVNYRPLDASNWEPQEAGLFGPVRLKLEP